MRTLVVGIGGLWDYEPKLGPRLIINRSWDPPEGAKSLSTPMKRTCHRKASDSDPSYSPDDTDGFISNDRMTNGGKSTMSSSLHMRIPNSCIIAQDAFFKDDSVIAVDSNGFKQYDVLDALHMDRMMSKVESWWKDPDSFLTPQRLRTQCSVGEEVFVLIVEGFLIFNYGPLNELMDKKYFLEIPYDVCKERRGSRVYTPPDQPGYFDGYVWPMYLKNRQEMEDMVLDIVFLDGLKSKEDLMDYVYRDITKEIQSLMGKD